MASQGRAGTCYLPLTVPMLQERARLERLLEEDRATPFRPAINACFDTRRPLLKLADPSPYLEHERAQAAQREQAARQLARHQQVHASWNLRQKPYMPHPVTYAFWRCITGGQCLLAETL